MHGQGRLALLRGADGGCCEYLRGLAFGLRRALFRDSRLFDRFSRLILRSRFLSPCIGLVAAGLAVLVPGEYRSDERDHEGSGEAHRRSCGSAASCGARRPCVVPTRDGSLPRAAVRPRPIRMPG